MKSKKDKKREDIEMICVNCKKKFIFTVGEQEFFKAEGLRYPIRCEKCRGQNKKYKGVPTIVGQKNPTTAKVASDTEEQKRTNAVARTESYSKKKCGECAIGNSDSCSRPMHKSNDRACDQFVSKKILPKEMEESFPSQGKASNIKFGKAGRSQFKRSKHETQ